MNYFSRGDLVRISQSNIFGVVKEVVITEDKKIEYIVLNIKGMLQKFSGDEINEITRVRPFANRHG